jgi:hypothetical protein
MSEHDQSRKLADKGAAIANETLQKGKAAVDHRCRSLNKAILERAGQDSRGPGLVNPMFLRCSLIKPHQNGRRVSVHWFAGVLQSLCSPS